MSPGGYTALHHVKWEAFMGFGLERTCRWLLVICVAVDIAIPWTNASAAEFGFSGMHVQGVDDTIAKALSLPQAEGVLVMDVALGGAADIAKIKRGDRITHFNGTKIDTFKRLVSVVTKTRPGQKVDVKVQRKRRTLDLKMKLGSKPASWKVTQGAVINFTAVGLTLASITPKIRERFNLRWGSVGVLVTLIDSTFADRMLLRRGDVIVQINQSDVWRPDQIKRHYNAAKEAGRAHLLMLIERTNGFRYMMLPVK